MVPTSETINRLGFKANHWRSCSVWGHYQKSLLSYEPPDTSIVSSVQGRSWTLLTSDLIHYDQVCCQTFIPSAGEEGRYSA